MADCSSTELRLQLCESLASCASFAQLSDRALDPLAVAMRATSSVFIEFVERPGQGVVIGRRDYVGGRPWSLELYAERYHRFDPLLDCGLQPESVVAGDSAAIVTTLPARGPWLQAEYGQRFLRPCDIGQVLGVLVPYRSVLGAQLLCLGFHRRRSEAPFGAAETGLVRHLATMIGLVLTGIAAREASHTAGAVLGSANRRGGGFLVFDEDLMLLHAGGSALADLGMHDHAAPAGGPQSSLLGELRQRLLRLAPRTGAAPRRLSLARGGDQPPVEVEIETVVAASGTQHIATTAIAGQRRDLSSVLRRFGLTERELEVARLVCAGHGNAEIARMLGIALRTVENHLRSVFAKAGVSSRTQLVARLLP